MRNCQECGTAVGETWEYCLRCGEALPPPADEEAPRGVLGRLGAALGLKAAPARTDPIEVAEQEGFREPAWRTAASRFVEARAPLWLTGALVAVLSIALLLAVAFLPGNGSGLGEARQAEAAARAEVDRLSGELEQARTALASAEERAETAEADLAALTAEASESQGTLEQTRQEAVSLRQQLEEVSTELETQEETLATRDRHVELLQECVAGMEVVVQFARNGLLQQAAQAEQVVAATCEEARTLP